MEMAVDKNLCAPCGAYCGACWHYYRLKRCLGCCNDQRGANCRFTLCVKERGIEFCCECDEFPCARLRRFSSLRPGEEVRHYRHVAMDNLRRLKEVGLDRWVEEMEEKFKRWEYHIGPSGKAFWNIKCACVTGKTPPRPLDLD